MATDPKTAQDKKFRILAPNGNFNGTRATLRFTKGEAFTNDEKLANRLLADGYTVNGKNQKGEQVGVTAAAVVPPINEVRVPLTDPDGQVRERTVAVVGGLTAGTGDGPDWTTLAEAEPTDPVAWKEARAEYGSDEEVIADKTEQELEKVAAGTPQNHNAESAGGTDPAPTKEQRDVTPDAKSGDLKVEEAPEAAVKTTTNRKTRA